MAYFERAPVINLIEVALPSTMLTSAWVVLLFVSILLIFMSVEESSKAGRNMQHIQKAERRRLRLYCPRKALEVLDL
jgi:hypothetical protein